MGESPEYKAYTRAPTGNKALKKLSGIDRRRRGVLKDSYQEFSVEHLYVREERRKYGKKMLDTLMYYGMMEREEYDDLLPWTRFTEIAHENDPLMERLKEYYLLPIWDKSNNRKVDIPNSGNLILHDFMNGSGEHQNWEPFKFREVLYEFQSRMHRGPAYAIMIFCRFLHHKFIANGKLQAAMGEFESLYEELKKDVEEPLNAIVDHMNQEVDWTDLDELDTTSATVKNVDISRENRKQQRNKCRNLKSAQTEVYWV